MNPVLNDSKPSAIDYLIESIKASKTNCSNQSSAIKFPCGLCTREVKHNDKAIFCTSCLSWVHIKCNGITIDEYKFRMRRNCENPELVESEEWVCLNCAIAERASIFPLGYLSNHELNSFNVSDSMEIANMIPEFEAISVALKSNNLASNDIDENLIDRINSKYYTIDEFTKIKSVKKSFNIFHSNVDDYECHSEGLGEILSKSSLNFDVVCLSETSQQLDHVFPKNVILENYHYPFSTITKSKKEGVVIFVKDNYNVKERHDLNICDKEFEANWIEINLKKSKNIIVGCIYRRPHSTNIDEFISNFNKCLSNKENKEVYISGDFNISFQSTEYNQHS